MKKTRNPQNSKDDPLGRAPTHVLGRENCACTQKPLSGPTRANRFSQKKKTSFLRIDFPKKMGEQRGPDANHVNFNANRREDAIRANLDKRFKNKCFFCEPIDSRESANRWCANRRPTKHRVSFRKGSEGRLLRSCLSLFSPRNFSIRRLLRR